MTAPSRELDTGSPLGGTPACVGLSGERYGWGRADEGAMADRIVGCGRGPKRRDGRHHKTAFRRNGDRDAANMGTAGRGSAGRSALQWLAMVSCTTISSWQTTPVDDAAGFDAMTLPGKNASKNEITATRPTRDRAVRSLPGNRLRRTLASSTSASSGRGHLTQRKPKTVCRGRALIWVKRWPPRGATAAVQAIG